MIIHAVIEHVGRTCTANRSRCSHQESDTEPIKKDRQAGALELLQKSCPRDEHNKYIPQVVPVGVKVWYHQIGTNRIYPAQVTKRTVHVLCGPVAETAPLYVVPDSTNEMSLADDFVASLTKWGYTTVRTRPVGYAEKFTAENPVSPAVGVRRPVATIPQHLVEAKAQHPEMLLIERQSDRYAHSHPDDHAAIRAAGLPLEVPTIGLESHLKSLLLAGLKVAVLEPVSGVVIEAKDPRPKTKKAAPDGPKFYGWDITYRTNQNETLTCHYVGTEATARRKAMLRTHASEVIETKGLTEEQWVRAYGRGRM